MWPHNAPFKRSPQMLFSVYTSSRLPWYSPFLSWPLEFIFTVWHEAEKKCCELCSNACLHSTNTRFVTSDQCFILSAIRLYSMNFRIWCPCNKFIIFPSILLFLSVRGMIVLCWAFWRFVPYLSLYSAATIVWIPKVAQIQGHLIFKLIILRYWLIHFIILHFFTCNSYFLNFL